MPLLPCRHRSHPGNLQCSRALNPFAGHRHSLPVSQRGSPVGNLQHNPVVSHPSSHPRVHLHSHLHNLTDGPHLNLLTHPVGSLPVNQRGIRPRSLRNNRSDDHPVSHLCNLQANHRFNHHRSQPGSLPSNHALVHRRNHLYSHLANQAENPAANPAANPADNLPLNLHCNRLASRFQSRREDQANNHQRSRLANRLRNLLGSQIAVRAADHPCNPLHSPRVGPP